MKILYAGSLNPYGTAFSRLQSIRELADETVEFDVTPYLEQIASVSKWQRDVKFISTSKVINRDLLECCKKNKVDVLWLDTGDWISKKTIDELRTNNVFLVKHTTDALYPKKPLLLRIRRHWLRRHIAEFDLIFTSNERDCAMMQQKHGDKFQLTDLGYDHRRFNADPMSPELQEKWNNDLVFIGHHEKRTEAAILALIDAGVNVQVYGHGPWFRSKNSDRLAPHLKERLSNEDYESALKGAKIGFCSHSEWNYNQTAARSFEIPASGTFLLALRSQRHQEFYKEGEEAEFFLNHDELVRKTKHYLAHSEEREKIAAAGHRRAVDGGYSWDAIMKRDWEKVLVAYNSQKK